MVAEIVLVSIGDNADIASAARQNAQYVARGLSAIGYKVREQISVCGSVRQLQQAVAVALKRSHILVMLGGMGRESGYAAKQTLAQGLGLPLEMNGEALHALKSYCHRTGETYGAEDAELANLPRGSVAFPAAYGKIPGCVISSSKQHIVLLPETPGEVVPMFNRYVSPYLGGKASTTVSRTVRTYGATEQSVREALGRMVESTNPAITLERERNEVLVRVSAHDDLASQAAALCTPVLQDVVDKLGDAAYGLDVDSLQSALIGKLRKKNLDVAIAEAGTAGVLTRLITETEGGQDVLRYSLAADEDAVKVERLGLPARPLKKKGGVSEFAVVEMASAVRERARTDIGIAVAASTSENETRKCPAGNVYIAVCDRENIYIKKLVVGAGDALDDTIVDAAVNRALNMARLFVDYLPAPYHGAISLAEALDGKTVTDKGRYVDEFDPEILPEEDDGESRKKRGGMVRRAVFLTALVVFIASGAYLSKTVVDSYQARQLADQLNNMYGETTEISEVDLEHFEEEGFLNYKFAGLYAANSDVRGFIRIQGTQVNYPVVQKYDNDYYLRRDFYGKSSQHGVPFFDYRVDLEKPSDNMVVYGHNMTDGQLFGELVKYKELEYYQEHPTIEFSTVYGDGVYKVFSVFVTNAYKNQGHVFDYYNFIEAQDDNAFFQEFLDQLEARSVLDIPVDAKPGDQLLTLSTCSYELQDMRTVIVARKVRKGEDIGVNTAAAKENPDPLYPEVWYRKYGGTPPTDVDAEFIVGTSRSTSMGYKQDLLASQAPGMQSATVSVAASASSSSSREEADKQSAASQSAAESSSLAEQSRREEESQRTEQSREAAEAFAASASEAEANRLAEESLASEQAKQAQEEADRLQAEREEASRLEEEARMASEASEASRLAEESRQAEEARAASEAAEASRLAEEEAARKSQSSQGGAMVVEEDDSGSAQRFANMATPISGLTLKVRSGGSVVEDDAFSVVSKVVENEVGASFNTEAIKAQALAAYSYIAHQNANGTTPSVYMSDTVSAKVRDAVSQVIGQAVYFNGSVAFTPYYATSGGVTTSSQTVWGGAYPYLVSVDSSPDRNQKYYRVETQMSKAEVAERISSRLKIEVTGDPSTWIEVLSYNDGIYVGDMRICGQTKSGSGSSLNGRLVRETVLNLRSAAFEMHYDPGTETFTFVTYGHGHGVGMSQNGANYYANQGWSYEQILNHYYPGTTVI